MLEGKSLYCYSNNTLAFLVSVHVLKVQKVTMHQGDYIIYEANSAQMDKSYNSAI